MPDGDNRREGNIAAVAASILTLVLVVLDRLGFARGGPKPPDRPGITWSAVAPWVGIVLVALGAWSGVLQRGTQAESRVAEMERKLTRVETEIESLMETERKRSEAIAFLCNERARDNRDAGIPNGTCPR